MSAIIFEYDGSEFIFNLSNILMAKNVPHDENYKGGIIRLFALGDADPYVFRFDDPKERQELWDALQSGFKHA